jgi:hypothetical protein
MDDPILDPFRQRRNLPKNSTSPLCPRSVAPRRASAALRALPKIASISSGVPRSLSFDQDAQYASRLSQYYHGKAPPFGTFSKTSSVLKFSCDDALLVATIRPSESLAAFFTA